MRNHQNPAEPSVLGWTKKQDLLNFVVWTKKRLNINGFLAFNDGDVFLLISLISDLKYRTRAIITRSWSETALVYKPRILGLKNEEFSFLVHKWSVI